MNSSSSSPASATVPIAWEYSTFILGSMFIISEVLPLLKGKSNGFLQSLLCLIKGSKCFLEKVEDAVDSKIQRVAVDIP